METMSNINNRSKRIKNGFSRSSKILMSLYTSKSANSIHQHQQRSMMKPPSKQPSPVGGQICPSNSKTAIPGAATPPHNSANYAAGKGASPAFIILQNQDQLQVYPQKVAVVVPDRNRHHEYSCGKLESYYGVMAEDDEAVDAKAAKFITDVQERFRSA